jgi:hypothetical protein
MSSLKFAMFVSKPVGRFGPLSGHGDGKLKISVQKQKQRNDREGEKKEIKPKRKGEAKVCMKWQPIEMTRNTPNHRNETWKTMTTRFVQ